MCYLAGAVERLIMNIESLLYSNWAIANPLPEKIWDKISISLYPCR
jgi:hypothetical protein